MNTEPSTPFRIAAVQAAPVFMDLAGTVDKACALIEEAARGGASVVAFPEAFVPAYPFWVWHIPAGRTHPLRSLYAELLRNSVVAGDASLERIGEAAADHRVAVAIGVNERNSEGSNTTLYNALAWFGHDGRFLGIHRKLIPTSGERLVYSHAPGYDLKVFDLSLARVSGLVCWENYMPLARYSLAAAGEQIHIAPTWDRGEPWISTMRHIAKESRCFVIGVCQALHKDDVPDRFDFKHEYLAGIEGWVNPGGSLIVDPDGKVVAGPMEEKEGILYADVHPDQLTGPRWQLDIGGHYARPDLFSLSVNREARSFLSIETVDHDTDAPECDAGNPHLSPPPGAASI